MTLSFNPDFGPTAVSSLTELADVQPPGGIVSVMWSSSTRVVSRYFWDKTSTTTADGLNVVESNSHSIGRWLFIGSPDDLVALESLGVSPANSAAENASALQAAFDAGGSYSLTRPGTYDFNTTITMRPTSLLTKYGDKGIGLRFIGGGPGNVVLRYTGSSSSPAILLDAPASLANRQYLTRIGGFSLTNENALGTVSGSGIELRGSVSTGEVNHTQLLYDMFIDGFEYGLSLDDCTLTNLYRVWFAEFDVAVRIGYNVDLLCVDSCMFGSEQFGTSFRNDARAFEDSWVSPFSSGTAAPNAMHVSNSWFMKIGDVYHNQTGLPGPFKFENCYFEDVRRYFHGSKTDASAECYVTHEQCIYSLINANDFSSTDPTSANYGASFQFDGVQATGVGAQPMLRLVDCRQDGQRANALVSWVKAGRVSWENNRIQTSSGGFGHLRSIRTNFETWRILPFIMTGSTADGTYHFVGKSNSAGLYKTHGEEIEVTATITASSTYSMNYLSGDRFVLTLPDGNCTIDHIAYSGTPPSCALANGSRIQVELRVPASVGATRTITWGSRLKMNAATLNYTAAEQSKRCVIELVCIDTSNNFQLVSTAPVFV